MSSPFAALPARSTSPPVRSTWTLLLTTVAFLAVLALAGARPAPAQGVGTTSTGGMGSGCYGYAGPKNCNCTEADAELEVCKESKVDLEVGGKFVKVKTGQSESSCAEQVTPPGECIFYKYLFCCTWEEGWFFGLFGSWDCRLASVNLKSAPATAVDCA